MCGGPLDGSKDPTVLAIEKLVGPRQSTPDGPKVTTTVTAVGASLSAVEMDDQVELRSTAPLHLRYTQRGSPGWLGAFAVLVGAGVWQGMHLVDQDSFVPFVAVSSAVVVATLYAVLVHVLNHTNVVIDRGVLSVFTGPVPVFRGALQQVRLGDGVDVELWLLERTVNASVARGFSVTVDSAAGKGALLHFPREAQATCVAHLLARACADR